MSHDPSPQRSGRHWANVNEFSFLAGMRLMLWIYRVLGRWPFRLALYPVLLWYVMIRTDARRASRKYLQLVAKKRVMVKRSPAW